MTQTGDNQQTVLVIEDEKQMQRLLRVILESAGYKVHVAGTGNDGIQQAARFSPHVIILDLGLPDIEGLTVLKRLREFCQTPVVVLSVRNEEDDKVLALENHADDYVTKPFGARELIARLRAAQRGVPPQAKASTFRCGNLSVDLVDRSVKVGDRRVRLTLTEYALLSLFVRNAGKTLTHGQIVREVWGPDEADKSSTLRVHINRLREKLDPNPADPQLFITEPGVGYRLAFSE